MGRIVFEDVRGLDGIKEATLNIKPGTNSPFKMFEGADGSGISLRIAVANGLGNAKKLIKVGVWARKGVGRSVWLRKGFWRGNGWVCGLRGG